MDFTREPIIESIITPKEGCKLVIRSSKGTAQEEFFVDSIEVVSFGHTFFYRSKERPKSFLVPVTDYEILEVREPRMVLKTTGLDRSVKIGSGRKKAKDSSEDKKEEKAPAKKRKSRRRRSQETKEATTTEEKKEESTSEETKEEKSQPKRERRSSLIPPPTTLISETIEKYKGDEVFKDVFTPETESETDITSQEALTQIASEEPELAGTQEPEEPKSANEENETAESEQEVKTEEWEL